MILGGAGCTGDVKRGYEAKISRPRPGSWCRGRDEAQGFEVNAKVKAKDSYE